MPPHQEIPRGRQRIKIKIKHDFCIKPVKKWCCFIKQSTAWINYWVIY